MKLSVSNDRDRDRFLALEHRTYSAEGTDEFDVLLVRFLCPNSLDTSVIPERPSELQRMFDLIVCHATARRGGEIFSERARLREISAR